MKGSVSPREKRPFAADRSKRPEKLCDSVARPPLTRPTDAGRLAGTASGCGLVTRNGLVARSGLVTRFGFVARIGLVLG